MPKPVARYPYRIEPLAKRHDRTAFASGSAELDRYLQQQARQDAEKRAAASFVLLESAARAVLGYYTLSASIVTADELPAALSRKLPRYPQLPVTLLGRLAVDHRHKGKGLGEFLLMDALHRSLQAADHIGAMAVVVDAEDAAAEAFYKHFDFRPLQQQPTRLYLPMKILEALFSR